MEHKKAWQLIDQVGWCQDQWVKRNKQRMIIGYCAHGAIDEVYGYGTAAFWAAIDTVRATIGDPHITRWNDAPERTKEQVVAALKEANV